MAQSFRGAHERPSPSDKFKQAACRYKPTEYSIVPGLLTRRKSSVEESEHKYFSPCYGARLAITAHTAASLAATLRNSRLDLHRAVHNIGTILGVEISRISEIHSNLSHTEFPWLSHNLRQSSSSSVALSSSQRRSRRFHIGTIYPRCWRFCHRVHGRHS